MKIKDRYKALSVNNKIVLKNATGAFIVKGGALIISLLTTPAFIRYFNNNAILGVWYTLLSVLIWFLNFDLGIGNGVRNNLVKAFAVNDKLGAKKIISSGLFSVGIVTVALTIIGSLLISLLDLNWVFNISTDAISHSALRTAAIFVFFAIMLRFMLTTVSSVFYALQKSAINNLLSLCVSILQLLFVLLFHFESAGKALIILSLAYIILSNLPLLIAGIVLFATKLKDCAPSFKYIEKKYIKAVLSIGGVFFVCQIFYMLIANSNEFLITNLFGPERTADYTFYYKLTSLISMVVSLALTPVWSVVTKAMVEKNYEWLGKLYRTIKIVGIVAIVLQFAMVPFLQFIMNIWLGERSIEINYVTAIAFACFGGSFVYSGMLSTIVCGLARMKLQTIVYGVGVVFKFLFVILMSKVTSVLFIVVWSNTMILLPYCVAQQIDLDIYMKKLRKSLIIKNDLKEGATV